MRTTTLSVHRPRATTVRLAGAGLLTALLLPGVAAAQDPAATTPPEVVEAPVSISLSGEAGFLAADPFGVMPVTAQTCGGGMVIVGAGPDGSQTIEIGEPPMACGEGVFSVGTAPLGGPGLPGVVIVAADAGATVEVTAVDGAIVSLRTDDGWTRTVDTGTVAITLDGDTLTAADLSAGDRVQVLQVRNANDTYTITGLAVVLEVAMGTVSAVTDTGFTVTSPDGTATPVIVTDETRWPATMPGATPGLAGLKDGDMVHVRGTVADDGTMTAIEVVAMGSMTFSVGDPAMPAPVPAPVETAPTPEPSPGA